MRLNFPNWVKEEKDLYGRAGQLEEMALALSPDQRSPVLILGERCIGKTSLLTVGFQYAQQKNGFIYHPLNIQPRGITRVDQFVEAIFIRISEAVGKKLDDTGLVRPDGSFHLEVSETFSSGFNRLIKNRETGIYLICVDEFDELIQKVDSVERLCGLVNHLTEASDLPVRFLFTMARVPPSIQSQVASPFTNISIPISLNSLEMEEAVRMVEEITAGEMVWPAECLEELYRIAGGHPYITKLILHYLKPEHETAAPSKVSLPALERALQAALKSIYASNLVANLYQANLWDELEKGVLLALAGQDGELIENNLKNAGRKWLSAARSLARRGYLYDKRGRYGIQVSFIGQWLYTWEKYDEELEKYTELASQLSDPVLIEVDESTRKVYVQGSAVSLSSNEYEIMHHLSAKNEELVKREDLVDLVWQTKAGVTDEAVDAAFSRLRKKLGNCSESIETVPGQGFILHNARLTR